MTRHRVGDPDPDPNPSGAGHGRASHGEHRPVLTALGQRDLVEPELVGPSAESERHGGVILVRQ
jgi:hypothetical protein